MIKSEYVFKPNQAALLQSCYLTIIEPTHVVNVSLTDNHWVTVFEYSTVISEMIFCLYFVYADCLGFWQL